MGRQRSCTNLWRRYPPNSRRNRRGIWLYKRSFRHRILRFFLLQRRRLRLNWSGSLLAVDTPRSRTQRPRSARLIRLQRAPASQQFRSRSLQLSRPSRPPVFFLPGTCEEKTTGQRFSAPGWERAHAGSDPACLAFATQRDVSRPFYPTWPASLCKRERSGFVRGKWRWAGRWQHVTGSFRCWGAVGLSDWPRPLRFARAQRRQSWDGCWTFPCPFQSGWRAGFGVVFTRGALSQPSGWVVSAGAPSGPSTTTIAVLPRNLRRAHKILALPLLCQPRYFCFICPHYGWRRWRKGLWEDASTGWVSGCTSLPTHCHRLEGESQSPVQAMQDHFSARWTLLRFSWTGGFGAPLYGGSPGLSGQAPLCRRRVWAWSCDSQGAEKRNGPSFASQQDYHPSHRKVYGQPGSARAPPVAHADGDQGHGQGLLPWCSNFPQRPLWTCGERIRWALHRSTEGVTGYATLPAQALQPSSCSESPQDCADSAARETCTCRLRSSAC